MSIWIAGLGTANPSNRWSQRDIFQTYDALMPMSPEARDLLHRFFHNESIGYRYLALDSLTDALETSQDALIGRFQRFAVPMATEAAERAMQEAGIAPPDVDALIVNTCTGYLCPGLTSYVAEALDLRKDIWPFDLMGMGCGGAIPNLETASNYLSANPNRTVLSIAVEVCSATLVFNESPDILVSNAIFGDGAAAMVLTNRRPDAGIELLGTASGIFPEGREHLHYRWEEGKLRNVLSARVPVVGARYARQVVDDLLTRQELTYNDISHWIVHPGGEKVLDAFERTTGVPPAALAASRRVLYEYGNMSSASVLFALRETLENHAPAAGDLGILCSFGAGFTAFAGLIRFG